MRPTRWHLSGRPVLDWVGRNAAKEVREELDELVDRLCGGPYPKDGIVPGILPFRTEGGVFTVPFDNALLSYYVTIDIPAVILVYCKLL